MLHAHSLYSYVFFYFWIVIHGYAPLLPAPAQNDGEYTLQAHDICSTKQEVKKEELEQQHIDP